MAVYEIKAQGCGIDKINAVDEISTEVFLALPTKPEQCYLIDDSLINAYRETRRLTHAYEILILRAMLAQGYNMD